MSQKLPEKPKHEEPDALVVLGCRTTKGVPGSALLRRLRRAERVSREIPALAIIMSGGQKWQEHTEAAIMANWWAKQKLPLSSLQMEEESLSTLENAAKVALICKRLRYRHLVLVTCDFHMPRAERLFSKHGLRITTAEATRERGLAERVRLQGREWTARVLEFFGTLTS